MIKKQKGFTLLEIVIAIVILASFLSIIYVAVSNLTNNLSRQRNEVYPEVVAQTLKTFYLENSYDIDVNKDAVLNNGKGVNIVNKTLTTDEATEKSLQNIYKENPNKKLTIRDGYNQPMLVLVSEMLENNYEGTMIPYRVIAVISSSNQDIYGVDDFKTTMDVETGEVLAPTEEGEEKTENIVVINTLKYQIDKFEETRKKIENLSNAYSKYYWSRYNFKERVKTINYFASDPSDIYWDKRGETVNDDDHNALLVKKSCKNGVVADKVNEKNPPGVPIDDVDLIYTLGLSNDYKYTAWGKDFYIMNCKDGGSGIPNVYVGENDITVNIRTPDVVGGVRQGQPFTAVLGFTMSNGQSYIELVSSSF